MLGSCALGGIVVQGVSSPRDKAMGWDLKVSKSKENQQAKETVLHGTFVVYLCIGSV